MNTFGLTSPIALNVRLLRADGTVHSVAPFKRFPRVHNGALVILRKSRLMPIVAINSGVADVVLGAGELCADDTVDTVAPTWRVETPKPASEPKPAKVRKPAAEPAPVSDALAHVTQTLAAMAERQNALEGMLAAFLQAQTPKQRAKRA